MNNKQNFRDTNPLSFLAFWNFIVSVVLLGISALQISSGAGGLTMILCIIYFISVLSGLGFTIQLLRSKEKSSTFKIIAIIGNFFLTLMLLGTLSFILVDLTSVQ